VRTRGGTAVMRPERVLRLAAVPVLAAAWNFTRTAGTGARNPDPAPVPPTSREALPAGQRRPE
jgi:hypothetical protein